MARRTCENGSEEGEGDDIEEREMERLKLPVEWQSKGMDDG